MAQLRVIREPAYALVWAGLSFLIFDMCVYLMVTLTGSRDNMCMVGANLTVDNIVFSLLLSLGFGLLITMLLYSLVRHVAIGAGTSLLGTIGSIVGFFTLFCGVCSFSLLSSLVATFSLGAISLLPSESMDALLESIADYGIYIKLACLVMIGVTVWLLDEKIESGWMCKLPRKKATSR